MVKVRGKLMHDNFPQLFVFGFHPQPGRVKPVIGVLLHSEGLIKSIHY